MGGYAEYGRREIGRDGSVRVRIGKGMRKKWEGLKCKGKVMEMYAL